MTIKKLLKKTLMKQLITTASLCLLMSNFLVAQEKVKSSTSKAENITVKKEKEPCFTSEFDVNGKEIKVPCGTKKATLQEPSKQSFVIVFAEHDPITGAQKHYTSEYDINGNEIKFYGKLTKNFNEKGESNLLFTYKTDLGAEKTIPAKMLNKH